MCAPVLTWVPMLPCSCVCVRAPLFFGSFCFLFAAHMQALASSDMRLQKEEAGVAEAATRIKSIDREIDELQLQRRGANCDR